MKTDDEKRAEQRRRLGEHRAGHVADVARSFAAAGRADIAQGITGHRTAPGCGLVVISWPGGTQLHQHELAAPSKGGRG